MKNQPRDERGRWVKVVHNDALSPIVSRTTGEYDLTFLPPNKILWPKELDIAPRIKL